MGQVHSTAVTTSGAVVAWGDYTHGQLGNGAIGSYVTTPQSVQLIAGAQHLTAGGFHTLAETSTGTVYAWGGN